jgi:hypothetical protein
MSNLHEKRLLSVEKKKTTEPRKHFEIITVLVLKYYDYFIFHIE